MRNLKKTLRNKTHTAEILLETMMTTTHNPCHLTPTKALSHVGYITEMSDLTYKTAHSLMGIEPTCRTHTSDTELRDFGTSIINIGCKTTDIYRTLCTKEVSIAEANLDLNRAMKALQQGKDDRQLRIREAAKTSYACITNNHNSLKQEITQHKNYLTADSHTITQGMRKREPWTEHMEKITKDLSDLNAMTYNNNIPRTDVDIGTLERIVNTLQDLLQKVISKIEEADKENVYS